LKAIVYHTIQFCDFYGFEYARMPRRRPALKIETDYANASSGQMVTRLQAFFESNGILLGKGCMDRSGAPPHGSAQAETSRRFEGKDEGAKANMADTYCAGTDSGSTTTNVVIMGGDGRIVAAVTVPTGADSARAARAAMDEALRGAGLAADDIACSVATGYGRASVPSATKDVTEITCHAKGAHRLAPEARTVIDIGGQDSKVIRLDGEGGVAEFSMNDKCAAGTGRFLELMADTLGMSMDEMARSGLNPRETVNVSSMCAVFAESEVISLIAQGKDASDIAWGIDLAIAGRVAAMATRIGATPPYVMTGGVANNEGVVKALSGKFRESGDDVGRRTEFFVPENPQMCGALGAAVIARDMVQTARRNI
jgi:predicted CoA-substrate-specific enzyme activase